ncbi:MAG: zinc ribbon domain-containing protein, partial [Candidatus Poribacteria bacterium]|nr:zinc ribbon domain-containing protein [Candidatus Poribacteria bacterium]
KKDDLTLSDRQYHCSNCGTFLDRDVNAALNLKQVAVGYTET